MIPAALTVLAIGLPILLLLVALFVRVADALSARRSLRIAADLAAAQAQARADAASGLTAARLRHPSVRGKL